MPAHLLVVGVSHRSAPVCLRERLAIQAYQLGAVLPDLRARFGLPEVVVLSTCNRIELYAATDLPQESLATIRDFFVSASRGDADTVASHLYSLMDQQAAAHLFRVTAGLDSMILGESEIAAQVKQAYQAAHAAGVTGPVLNRVFQKALHIAKLIRSRTGLAHGSASIGSVVVDLAGQLFAGRLTQCEALLWGAGKAAEATARHLIKAGIKQLWIVNRTQAKAEDLASLCRGGWLSWEQARAHLAHVDIAVVGTEAPHYVIDRDDLEDVLPRRQGRPLVIVDLAVPRNVDPSLSHLPGVRLYNIDDLRAIAQRAVDQRHATVMLAEELLQEQLSHFWQGQERIRHKQEDICELVEAWSRQGPPQAIQPQGQKLGNECGDYGYHGWGCGEEKERMR